MPRSEAWTQRTPWACSSISRRLRERIADRRRPVAEAVGEPELDLHRLTLLTGGFGVHACPLERGGLLAETAHEPTDLAAQPPRPRQPVVVAVRLEQRHDALRHVDDLAAAPGWIGLQEHELPRDRCVRLAELVTVGARLVERLLEQCVRLGELAELNEDAADPRQQLRLVGLTCGERRCTAEEVEGRREVAPKQRTMPCRGKADVGALAQGRGRLVHRPELCPEAEGLLEVVTDELLVLGGAVARGLLEKSR